MSESIFKTKTCEIHGDFTVEYLDMGGIPIPRTTPVCQICDTERKEREAAEQELVKKQAAKKFKAQQIEWAIENFNKWIPKRFANATIESFVVENKGQEQALNLCNRYIKSFSTTNKKTGGGLILTGNVGTGKTHLAIALGRELAKQGERVIYTNLTELIRSVRATWKGEGSERAILEQLIGTGLLIIDEAGVQNGTENERNILFEIIDGRYQDVKPTIIISNLNVDEVSTFISQRSVDRITHGGATIPFDWESQRGVVR